MNAVPHALSLGAELARSLDHATGRIVPLDVLLRAAEDDLDVPDAAQHALRELGWAGIAVGTDDGGLDLDASTQAKLAAVAGRRLLPFAIHGEAFGLAPALAAAALGGPLDELLGGSLRGGAATVDSAGTDGNFTGVSATVAIAPGASLVALVGPDACAILDLAEDSLEVEPAAALDSGQGARRVTVAGAIDDRRVIRDDRAQRLRRGWELAGFGHAFGAAQRALELSIEYATQRQQFGRKIVTFQAVSHRLAEMAVRLASLDSAIGRLAVTTMEGRSDDMLGPVLRHAAFAGAREVCESAIQVHGGMGFTWEFGLHLYLRRVLALQYAFGGAGESAQAIGERYLAARVGAGA